MVEFDFNNYSQVKVDDIDIKYITSPYTIPNTSISGEVVWVKNTTLEVYRDNGIKDMYVTRLEAPYERLLHPENPRYTGYWQYLLSTNPLSTELTKKVFYGDKIQIEITALKEGYELENPDDIMFETVVSADNPIVWAPKTKLKQGTVTFGFYSEPIQSIFYRINDGDYIEIKDKNVTPPYVITVNYGSTVYYYGVATPGYKLDNDSPETCRSLFINKDHIRASMSYHEI